MTLQEARIVDFLPAAYRALLPEWFKLPLPIETAATCSECAMVSAGASDDRFSYHPALKCCTYQPLLPSYLVGALLSDGDPTFTQELTGPAAGRAPLGAEGLVKGPAGEGAVLEHQVGTVVDRRRRVR